MTSSRRDRLGVYVLPEPVIDVGIPEGLALARALAEPGSANRLANGQGAPDGCR